MSGVGQLSLAGGDSLSMNLVSPAAIVTKDGDGLGQILAQSLLIRFAVIPRVDGGEDMLIAVTELGQAGQKHASVIASLGLPFL